MTAPLVRVLVVDDHPIVLDGVTMAVQHTSWLQVTGYARTGREAVVAVKALRPDVVLLDLRLPDMLGSEAVQPIRRSNPAVKIILFTAYPDHAALEAALAAGVDGVVVKDTEREALIEVIRRVMAGERVVQVDYDDAAHVSRKLREHGLPRRQERVLAPREPTRRGPGRAEPRRAPPAGDREQLGQVPSHRRRLGEPG